MDLTTVGATGGTGLELTKQAPALDPTVGVLVRSPGRVGPRKRLEVGKTDLLSEPAAELGDRAADT